MLVQPAPHDTSPLAEQPTDFYLSARSARLPHAAEATDRITATLGDLARSVLLVHRVRRHRSRPWTVDWC